MSLCRHRRNGSSRAGSLLPALSSRTRCTNFRPCFGGAHAPHAARLTCSARTTRRRSRKGDTIQRPRAPSVVSWTSRCLLDPLVTSCPQISFVRRHVNDSARSLRTVSPSPRRRTRQRCCGFLPARSPIDGSSCDSPRSTIQGASDRLLPLYTLTTSTCASLVPAS